MLRMRARLFGNGCTCSRGHFYPNRSYKLRIKNMYNGPGLAWEHDEGLEYTVATGENAEAVLPDIEGMEEFGGRIMHTSLHKSGDVFIIGKRVLVVGCGNSGMEVCLDLCNHNARPTLVVRNTVPTKVDLWRLPVPLLLAIYLRLDILARVNIRATSRYAKEVIEMMGFRFPPAMRSSKVVVSNKSWHLLQHPLTPMRPFQTYQVHKFSLVSENENHPQIRVPPLQLPTPVSNWNASIEFSGDLPSAVNLRPPRQPISRVVAGQAEMLVVPHYMEVQHRWIVGSADFDDVGPSASASEIATSDEGC